MFLISAFTFGGGFVIVTFMRRRFVEQLGWLEEKEMLDYTAIAQSCPGAIAVNAAILLGGKIGGKPGVFAAVLGTALPPFILLSVISYFYSLFTDNVYVALTLRGVQAGVAAVVLDVALELGQNVWKERSVFQDVMLIVVFFLAFFMDWSAIYLILAAASMGVLRLIWLRKGGDKL